MAFGSVGPLDPYSTVWIVSPPAVRRLEVPQDVLALATLARVDYADSFVVVADAGPCLTGEHWARAMLEQAPTAMRAMLRRGWTALGLRLVAERDAGAVLGWPIRHAGPDFALLHLESRIGMPAELLFRPEPDGRGLLFATLVRHENPGVRALWATVGPQHRQIVPRLLAQAAARVGGGPK